MATAHDAGSAPIATTAALHPLPVDEPTSASRSVTLSMRYQCPLCFDVLRRPIQLPCCRRHLCMECFERALELTSVNCGFCRKRIVGFARKKQYKVDNALWNEILAKCPFIGAALMNNLAGDDCASSWTIDFVDEQAAPRHASHAESQELKPGELKLIYEQRVREHQSQLDHAEALALEKTMDFLQSDPEYLASVARNDHQPTPAISISASHMHTAQTARDKATKPHAKASCHSEKASGKQQRLDTFFSTSTESFGDSPSQDEPEVVLQSPSRHRSKLVKLNADPRTASVHRGNTRSPRRRKPAVIQTTLFQLSSAAAQSSSNNSTPRGTSSSLKITPADKRRWAKSKASAETPLRRTPWRCLQCTFENTCFDRQCSMCHAAPPPLLS